MKRQPYTPKELRKIRFRRTERGKATYVAQCINARRASKAHKIRHRDFSYLIPPASPAVKRELKRLRELNRRLTVELHCRHMQAVHSANAAARRTKQSGDNM